MDKFNDIVLMIFGVCMTLIAIGVVLGMFVLAYFFATNPVIGQ